MLHDESAAAQPARGSRRRLTWRQKRTPAETHKRALVSVAGEKYKLQSCLASLLVTQGPAAAMMSPRSSTQAALPQPPSRPGVLVETLRNER